MGIIFFVICEISFTCFYCQVKIKRAASNAAGKLKTLKTKKQLNESRTTLGVKKRKIDESQMEEKSGNNISKMNKWQVFCGDFVFKLSFDKIQYVWVYC